MGDAEIIPLRGRRGQPPVDPIDTLSYSEVEDIMGAGFSAVKSLDDLYDETIVTLYGVPVAQLKADPTLEEEGLRQIERDLLEARFAFLILHVEDEEEFDRALRELTDHTWTIARDLEDEVLAGSVETKTVFGFGDNPKRVKTIDWRRNTLRTIAKKQSEKGAGGET